MGYYQDVAASVDMGVDTITTTKNSVTTTCLSNSAALENVVNFGGNWTHRVGSNTAYGYVSTRASIVLGGVNNTRSVTAVTTQATTQINTSANFATPNTGTATMTVTFTRGSSGTDSRQAWVNGAFINYTRRDYIPYYYTYYYAVNNASRGGVSCTVANGASSIEGTTINSTFTPNTGYYLDYIVDSAVAGNITINSASPYVYSVSSYANRTVTGYFGAYTYTVSTSVSGGDGTVGASPTSGGYGYTCNLTFTPAFGYKLDHFTLNGVSYTTSNNAYSFVVHANTAVVAYFTRDTNLYGVVSGTLRLLDARAVVAGVYEVVDTRTVIGGVLRK
jgi:hypothetical protein